MATVTYYFNSYNVGEAWSDTPENFVDGDTGIFTGWENNDNRIQLFDGNNGPGSNLGIITKVELRVFGKISGGASQFYIRPVFVAGDGDEHNLGSISFSGDWSTYVEITNDINNPGTWDWTDIQNLDCDVKTAVNGGSLAGAKVEIRVTYSEAGLINSGTAIIQNYYY